MTEPNPRTPIFVFDGYSDRSRTPEPCRHILAIVELLSITGVIVQAVPNTSNVQRNTVYLSCQGCFLNGTRWVFSADLTHPLKDTED